MKSIESYALPVELDIFNQRVFSVRKLLYKNIINLLRCR